MTVDADTGEILNRIADGLAIESRTRVDPGGIYPITGIIWAFDGHRYHTAHVFRKQIQLDSIEAGDARPVSGFIAKQVVRDTMKFAAKAIADGSKDERLIAVLVRLQSVIS